MPLTPVFPDFLQLPLAKFPRIFWAVFHCDCGKIPCVYAPMEKSDRVGLQYGACGTVCVEDRSTRLTALFCFFYLSEKILFHTRRRNYSFKNVFLNFTLPCILKKINNMQSSKQMSLLIISLLFLPFSNQMFAMSNQVVFTKVT
jgi:hypothetical protein